MTILAAMTPCSRLYGFLGLELEAAFPHAQHTYRAWVDTYSSPDYLALPAAKEKLMNTLADGADYGENQHPCMI
jgi:thiaminase